VIGLSYFYIDEDGVVKLHESYYEQTLIDYVGESLRTFASLRELLKDEIGNFKRPKEYLQAKKCPGWVGLCPNNKEEKDSSCNPDQCWNTKIKTIKDKIDKKDHFKYDNILIKVLSPSICSECGSSEMKIEWGKRVNVKVAGYTLNFENVAYMVCKKCGIFYMSTVDKKAIEVIKEKIRDYNPYEEAIEQAGIDNEAGLDSGYSIAQFEIPPVKTIILDKDKIGLEMLIEDLKKGCNSLTMALFPISSPVSSVDVTTFNICHYADPEDIYPEGLEDEGEDIIEE
jgi:hypothetical protein